MPAIQAQIWKGSTFTIERSEGKASGTVIFRLSGPFTARDMFSSLTPVALRNIFEFEPADNPPSLNIFDLPLFPIWTQRALA